MIAISDVLISEDVLESKFICDLHKCHGACCEQGDYGAPLESDELKEIEKIIPTIKKFISNESWNHIQESGGYKWYEDLNSYGTNLMPDGPCVFMSKDENGIASCSIEQAYLHKLSDFKKPISCHLYPIRIKKYGAQGFTVMNYDRWDICKPACALGKKNKIPLYQFLKEAIIRKFGIDFYSELDAAHQHLSSNETSK